MISITRSKKGNSTIFLLALITLMLIGLFYIGLREGAEQSLHIMNGTSMSFSGGDHETTVYQLRTYFEWYPILAVFVLIIWSILWSKNRQNGVYQ